MNWLNRAEAKFGHLALEGLPQILVGLNALVYVLYKINPHYLGWLTLDFSLVMKGEVWRLVSYIFIPAVAGILGEVLTFLFYLLFLWWVARGLEEAMGAFKFNVFYLLGMVGATIASCIGGDGGSANGLLNGSMLFAFARFYPETMIYLFLVLPVKVKWMAWGLGAWFLLQFAAGDWGYRLVLIAEVGNYLLFFGGEIIRDARHREQVGARRRRFDREVRSGENEPLHRCFVCGRTEVAAPDLEFRVSRDGEEYCLEHLPSTSGGSSAGIDRSTGNGAGGAE